MALSYVVDFIARIHAALSPGIPDEIPGLFITSGERETLFLTPPESTEYRQVVSRLVRDYAKGEDISRRTIERCFQEAIFDSLDINSSRGSSFERRRKEAVRVLHSRLTEKPTTYLCYVPVGGFDPKGLPWHVGPLRFVILNQRHIWKLSLGLKANDAVGTKQRKSTLAHMREPHLWNRPYGIVSVQARDFSGAMYLARRETRLVLDVLNFVSSLSRFIHGWTFLPGEAETIETGTPAQRIDGALSVSYRVEGPAHKVSPTDIMGVPPLKRELRRVVRLLRDRCRSELGDVLLTSIQWAGRAAVEPRREQAFLLYAIALETIMLPKSGTQELMYRLGIRTAHLLEKRADRRNDLCKKTHQMYEIRSRIVHSGSYEVTDENLGELQTIVRRAILRIMHHPTISGLQKRKDLDDWFERRLLH